MRCDVVVVESMHFLSAKGGKVVAFCAPSRLMSMTIIREHCMSFQCIDSSSERARATIKVMAGTRILAIHPSNQPIIIIKHTNLKESSSFSSFSFPSSSFFCFLVHQVQVQARQVCECVCVCVHVRKGKRLRNKQAFQGAHTQLKNILEIITTK